MATKLIIIRGNSGSGKTTIAKALHQSFARGTALLISQDVVRREMLGVSERKGNLAINLIKKMALYGKDACSYVILEGIFPKHIYKGLFSELYQLFEGHVFAYYFDLPFEETVRRHQTRQKAQEFGENELRSWWLEKDVLALPNETRLDDTQSQTDILAKLVADIFEEK